MYKFWFRVICLRYNIFDFFKSMISITFYPFAHQESKPPRCAVARCWRLYHFNAFALEDRWRSGRMVLVKMPGLVDSGGLPAQLGWEDRRQTDKFDIVFVKMLSTFVALEDVQHACQNPRRMHHSVSAVSHQ